MKKIIVIGGGAAGMLAAITAAREGADVTLIEKNEKLGKKVYITGKGRCNVANDCDPEDFFKNVVTNSKFMYSAYYSFDSEQVKTMLESAGCPLKTERGNRVFPVSDHSSDIIKALNNMLKDAGVEVLLNTEVVSIGTDGWVYTTKGSLEADAVIIATGGISYPATGSTGDGMKWAKKLGHDVKDAHGALVPLETIESDPPKMQGLSLKNVSLKMTSSGKKLYEGFGEMLFTHFGISGPLVLSASSYVSKAKNENDITVSIDLKPALSFEELDTRILKDFDEVKNKQFANALDKLLPRLMIPVIIDRCGIDPLTKVNEITREQRHTLVNTLKNYELHIKGRRPVGEAIITQGGVNVKEINPSTMESKIVPNLYFAGEVIDVDALTGGFNLQVAWSTGYLAGLNAAQND